MFCYRPKHCFRLFEGQQSARFRCGDRLRTRDSRMREGLEEISPELPQFEIKTHPTILKVHIIF